MSFKICVSGAAEGECLTPATLEKPEKVGQAIADTGAILVTGATTGIPHAAAKGAKDAGGIGMEMVVELVGEKKVTAAFKEFKVADTQVEIRINKYPC